MRRFLFCCFMLLCTGVPGYGQTDSILIADTDLLNIQFPPVSVLLESAVQDAPRRKYFEERKNEEYSLYKTAKREWMKYLTVGVNYKYGTMGGYYGEGGTDNMFITGLFSQEMQNWFQAGISINMPLMEFIDRKNKLNRQKIRMRQAEMDAERMSEEVKEKVITEYNNALMHLAILKTKAESLDLNNIQYLMSESNFVKGKIDISELARLKQLQVSALIDYEATKAQFRTSLMLLEMLTGYKLLNK